MERDLPDRQSGRCDGRSLVLCAIVAGAEQFFQK